MRCVITSSERTETLTDLESVTVITMVGQMEIKKSHAEYFANLPPSEVISVGSDGKETRTTIMASVCHVRNDVVTIIM